MTTLLAPPSAPRAPRAGADGRRPNRRRPAHARPQRRRRRIGRIANSRWLRFGLPALTVALGLLAAAALAFPVLSDWWASHRQHELASQLDDPTLRGQVAADAVGDGKPIGRIMIPAIGLDMVMVQGVDTSALEEGPGHYPGTPMPCTAGDSAVAGHRTTFLHPFYNLNEVKPGDLVEFQTAAWTCSYVVSQAPFSVLPTDTSVVNPTPGQYTLTLTTCTPRGSASQRLVVKGVMVLSSLHPTASKSAKTTSSHKESGSAHSSATKTN